MAASSTVMFIFALLAEERSYLSSSIFVNTITVVCDRSVRKKKSVLQIHFKLASNGFIYKMGFSLLELRKQNNDFMKFQSIIIQQSIYYRK